MNPSKERIKYLLRMWTSRKATPAEVNELFDWISETKDEAPVQTHIQQLVEEYQPGELMPAVQWESIYQKILDGRKTEEQPIIRRSFSDRFVINKKLLVAACIILIAGLAALIWLKNEASPEQLQIVMQNELSNDATPGRQGAILTLANGQKVSLDSLGNGVVSVQGKSTVMIRDGKLVYDAAASNGEIVYNTTTTPKGRQYQLVLPDGSQVWLNAASSITYPTAFSGNDRKVTVTGEAYFEVAKDPTKPFRVSTSNSEVEVLGTHFNINSYGDDGAIKTTLLEGSIKFIRQSQSVVLKPGQQVVAMINTAAGTASQKLAVRSGVDMDQVMAWKNGLFNFNHADLNTVMQQLARWYDIDVRYEGPIPSRKFKGEITRDLNLSQVLSLLEDVEVKFLIEGKTLIVTP
jgi:transmembrane sensor